MNAGDSERRAKTQGIIFSPTQETERFQLFSYGKTIELHTRYKSLMYSRVKVVRKE